MLERSTTVVNAVLVLDVSSSVQGKRLTALRQAAHALVDALWPTDSITLLAFATDLRLVARPGAPRPEVHAVVDHLEGGGATTLVDAAYAALLLTDPRRGRPLVVVFSDGVDRASWLTPEQALSTARASDAVVHYVEVEAAEVERARSFLGPLVGATGGQGWSARHNEGLRGAFVEALEEFKSRYRLRYEPIGVPPGGRHEITVWLVGQKGKERARPGYEVPGGHGVP